MRYYPIFLELKGRPCLVIGGGEIACRKVKALLSCGAQVRVVSPEAVGELMRLARQGKIRWHKKRFKASDMRGAQLAVAATDDQQVNKLASRIARRKRVWINVVDQPDLCSFIFPSVVRRGKLVLAVSTGGVSPALAKWIRRDIGNRYGPEFDPLLKKMVSVREAVKSKVPGFRRRKELFETALKAYMKVVENALK